MKALGLIAAITWAGLWFTPDQQGQRALDRGDFAAAAEAFQDPLREGVAWYRAGEFERSAQAFARRDSAEADYNQGNAWLMLGKYGTAIACYERALAKRGGWKEAEENRDLAAARAKMTEQQGGDLGDQKIGADQVVFDKDKQSGGQDTELSGDQASSDAGMQALWLRRVQTRPADFLKAKFSYQLATPQPQEGGGE